MFITSLLLLLFWPIDAKRINWPVTLNTTPENGTHKLQTTIKLVINGDAICNL